MSEQDVPEVELQELRQAADKGDWNGCWDAVEKLLRRLPPHQALELARKQVERRLPAFERHQPGVSWPRECLEALRVADPSGEEGRRWPWEVDFPGPGASSFTNAVEDLWLARPLTAEAPRRLELLVHAIARAVMTEMVEAWGARHPAKWARRYELRFSEGEAVGELYDIQFEMAGAPETVRIERAAWHDVADRLVEALGLSSPGPLPE